MAAAIHHAKGIKAAKLNEIAYLEKLNAPKVYHKFDYESLMAYVCHEHKVIRNPSSLETSELKGERFYWIDDYNREIFETLCMYFSGDPAFELQGDDFSFEKGIMLYGPVGCGKTSLMKMFTSNSFRPFSVTSCRVIADEYAKEGSDSLYKYSELQPAYPQRNYGIDAIGRLFDDLGTEDNKSHFGNKVNVMQDILYKIYENNLLGNFHVTTNIIGDEIEEFYGQRIRSRTREMFNVLTFDGNSPDRRK